MGNVNTTTAASLIPSRWSASILTDAQEERVVTEHFSAAEGEKINGACYIRRVAAIGAAAPTAGSPAFTSNTEVNILVSPSWGSAAVQIERAVFTRMDIGPDNAYRKQIAAGLGAYVDVLGANLASSLSTNVVGGGGVNLDYALVLTAMGKIITNSKNHFKAGTTPAWLMIHPSQYQYLMAQNLLISENIRGDGETPVRTGWMVKGAGFNMNESGNVLQSAGITHNLAYTPDAYALLFNEEPTVLPPQDFDLTVKIIGTVEAGAAEVYDAYAADVQTAA